MSDEPFPGSAADFYEKNQKLSEQLIQARVQNLHLKGLVKELADVVGEEFGENYGLTGSPITGLLQRAREATR